MEIQVYFELRRYSLMKRCVIELFPGRYTLDFGQGTMNNTTNVWLINGMTRSSAENQCLLDSMRLSH